MIVFSKSDDTRPVGPDSRWQLGSSDILPQTSIFTKGREFWKTSVESLGEISLWL